jgi:RHS repeat-associated protein
MDSKVNNQIFLNRVKIYLCFLLLLAASALNAASSNPPPDLTNWITSPNGGEIITIGSTITVNVNSSLYTVPTLVVELYKGSTMVWGPSYAGMTNRTISTSGLTSGNDYRVKIYNASVPSESDWSNSNFTIGTPPPSYCIAPTVQSGYGCSAGASISLSATNSETATPTCSKSVAHKWYTSQTGSTTVAHTIDATGTCAVYRTRVTVNAAATYWVSALIDGCETSRVQVTASYPSIGIPTTADVDICGSGSATINASTGTNGTDVKWFTTSNVNQTAFFTGNSYTTPNLTLTTTYYIGSYSSTSGCTSPRIPVAVNVNPIPSLPIAQDVARCGPGTVTLTASPGTNGDKVLWYDVQSGGSAILDNDGDDNKQTVTASATRYVTTKHTTNGCESSRKTIYATSTPLPTVPTVQDAKGCNAGSSIQLVAISSETATPTCTEAVTHKWYTSETGASTMQPIIHQTGTCAVYSTGINISAPQTFWVASVINQCESARVPISGIYSNDVPVLDVSPELYVNNGMYFGNVVCAANGMGSPTFNATGGEQGSIYEWYDAAVGGNKVFTGNVFNPTINIHGLEDGVKTYYVGGTLLNDIGCSFPISSRKAVSVKLLEYFNTGLDAGVDKEFFAGDAPVQLTPNSLGYNWYGAGTSLGPNGSQVTSGYFSPAIAGPGVHNIQLTRTYSYPDTYTSCESQPDIAVYSVYAQPHIDYLGAQYISHGQGVTLVAGGETYTSYQWIDEGMSIPGATSTTLPVIKTGIYGLRVTKGQISKTVYEEVKGAAQGDVNYRITYTPQISMKEDRLMAYSPAEQIDQRTEYFDELGRLMQVVNAEGSPSKNDIIQPYLLDQLGRETFKILPFTTDGDGGYIDNSTIINQNHQYIGVAESFYQNSPENKIADDLPIIETRFEKSPLNTILEQGAAGYAWQPDNVDSYTSTDHTVKYGYEFNQTGEVLKFSYGSPNSNNLFGSVGLSSMPFYNENELQKKMVKDEQGNEMIQFVDKEGKIILKRAVLSVGNADTYYIYDDYQNLVTVIQPEGSKKLKETSGINPWTSLNELSLDATFNLIKTGTNGYGTGTGLSSEILPASTDGWVEMAADETNTSRMIGLTASNSSSATVIDYAIEFRDDGNIYCWQNGIVASNLGPYVSGTVVRISREKQYVHYYVDGVTKYVNSQTPSSSALMVDLAINHTGGTIKGVGFSFTSGMTQALSNFSFRYAYDERNRMTHKLVPGASPVYMVYDQRDRLVLTQDGNQRSTSPYKWLFTKYDALNRPVMTGIKDTTALLSQSEMQTVVNNFYTKAWTKLYETYIGASAGNIHGYTNKSYPVVTTGNLTVANSYLTVTYYDNYDFKSLLWGPYDYASDGLTETRDGITYTQPVAANPLIKGLVTGSKVRVLDNNVVAGNTWLSSVSYYDDKYKVIQTISDNYKGGFDKVSTLYDFTGKVLENKLTHYGLSFKSLVAAQNYANKVRMTATTGGWGAAGAASVEMLPANQDGWIEFKAASSTHGLMVGLADTNPNADWTSIDYAWYLPANGLLQIRENGSVDVLTSLPPYSAGDVFRIERVGTSIKYYRNGLLLRTKTVSAGIALMVDIALNTVGAEVHGLRSSFGSATAYSINRRYEYDAGARLTHVWHKINSNAEVLVTKNEYNELGQLIDKKLHSMQADASDAHQSVDYRYNIRGWLTSMNNAALATDGTNNDSNDLFGFNLSYNDVTDLGNSALFNGNISAMKWSNNLGLGDLKEKGYTYGYDPLNRITSSNYKTKTSSWTTPTNNGFSETGYTYDLNGNMLSLTRYDGRGDGTPMDLLSYDYGTVKSNKLLKVTDAADDFKGFVDGTNSSDDYTYDANGNMLTDQNKGISSNITYNHLNLPMTITKGTNTLNYVYDATGRKLAQVTSYGAAWCSETNYAGEFNYQNNRLQFVNHEEGRVVLSGTETIGTYYGESTTGVTAQGSAAISLVTQNGTEKYLKVASTGSTGQSGAFPIIGGINVIQGERYLVRAKGYRTGSSAVSLIVKVGTTQVLTGSRLPGNTASSEAWTEQEIVVPANGIMQAGVIWSTVTSGQQFFVNELEIVKVTTLTQPEYQYHLKDHLGNVRVTFTTKQDIESSVATMEDVNTANEQSNFLYYSEAVKVNTTIFDHTNAGATYYSTRLNGSANERAGLARSISVMVGDTIKAEVYAKYLDTNSSNWTTALNSLITSIANGTAPAGTFVDGGAPGSTGGDPAPYLNLLDKSGETGTAPKAYLNYYIFDRDYNFLNGGSVRMTEAAREYGQDGAHEKLATQLVITQPGYVYICLSNDNAALGGTQVEVYFDDFKVEHIKSSVISMQDYYPFGLAFNSYSRENSTAQDFKYNGKEEQNELSLGWLDYGWRMYDPAIARWHAPDPFADKFMSWSPYNYVANNPVIFFDPDGRIIEGDVDRVEDLKDEANRLKGVEAKRQAKLQSKIDKRSAAGKSTARQERRMANSKERVNQLNGALNEISAMEQSETVYHINSDYQDQADGTSGETKYENGKVMVNVSKSYGLHGLAHELKHAYQFESRQLDFYSETGQPGLLYDIGDEVAAFKRQFAFNSSSLGSAKRFSDITPSFVSKLNAVYNSMPQTNLNACSKLLTMQVAYGMAGKHINFLNGNPANAGVTYEDAAYSNFILKE